MSFLSQIFSDSKEEKKPLSHEAIKKIKKTEDLLLKKFGFLEQNIELEVQTAKEHRTKNQREALAALKRKKHYEKQLTQMDRTLSQIEMLKETIEQGDTDKPVLKTMIMAAGGLDLSHKNIDVHKLNEIMDALAAQHAILHKVTDAILSDYFPNDYDEDELVRELEEMGQDDLNKEKPPNGPSAEPINVSTKSEES